MASNAPELSFEDLKISFERENTGEQQLVDKRKNEKHQKSTKNRTILPSLPQDAVNKQSLFDTPRLVVTKADEKSRRSKNPGTEKLGKTVKNDTARSFVSRLRANSWSPRQSKTPEFDSISLIHKTSEDFSEKRLFSHELNCIELMYQPDPSDEYSRPSESYKVPTIKHQNPEKVDQNNDNPRITEASPGYQDGNFGLESPAHGQECLNYTADEVSGSTFGNSRQKNINNKTHEGRKPTLQDSKLKGKSSRYEDRNANLDEASHPGYQDPELVDSKFLNARKGSNMSFKTGTVSSGRLFLPLRNDCENKSRNTLMPNCINRRRATSNESLPRVPLGKVNLVQPGVWQRLTDEDSPKGRNRSFTH